MAFDKPGKKGTLFSVFALPSSPPHQKKRLMGPVCLHACMYLISIWVSFASDYSFHEMLYGTEVIKIEAVPIPKK